MCSYARPIEVKGKDKILLHNKHGERSYGSENQYSGIIGLVRSGYHDSMSGVLSEGTLLNVYTIKNKS